MDTIFALASAPGRAGVSVIRVSGPEALNAVQRLAGDIPKARYAALRNLKDQDGKHLDQALVLTFENEASFTGEPVAEFHLHGSIAVIQAVLSELSFIPGLRIAEPGEFTRRALENGKMDLTQVEALSDLIDAETEAQRDHALRVMNGALSGKTDEWRALLIRSAALLEATIDFADEEVPVDVTDEVVELLAKVRVDLETELANFKASERVRTGFEIAIVGEPNTGKSTLLNYLAGRKAAITSEVAGTTRDVIEVRMDIGGFAVTLLDTAGIRDTDDAIETIGVDIARERADAADIRIHLINTSKKPVFDVRSGDVVAIAKQDTEQQADIFGVSGVTGNGVDQLVQKILTVLSERTQ
ncbi:MAG: tRNA uridine-5-carboxymethylaminomethyl(34) synthesis GTPase MnmE, partial [Amphritea sp.]|nr:tRNA uridine-5-carboxymethylaminomethyl(34) synthesis GTPase MnmE [Amphritea sp.]